MSQDYLDIFAMASNMFSTGAAGEAVVEEGAAPVNLVGRSRAGNRRLDLYRGIDVMGALSRPLHVGATTDFAMSVSQASEATQAILNGCGMANEMDNSKFFFLQAMQLCYAMNSASTQQPGRATFSIHTEKGGESSFNLFADVVSVLGVDTRRYFRAYADETRTVLRGLRAAYVAGPKGGSDMDLDVYDTIVDQWSAIQRVAVSRGLARVPDLVHDSAENCSGLTSVELAFLASSKASIFSHADLKNLVDNPTVFRGSGSGRVGAVVASAGGGELGDGF